MDFPADITLRKTRMKFELTFKVVLLFSYQGFVSFFFVTQLLYFISFRSFCQELFYFAVSFFRKRLIILSHSHIFVKNFFQELFLLFKKSVLAVKCELLYIITWFSICQEVFSFSFKILVIFLLKMSFSCATHIILS